MRNAYHQRQQQRIHDRHERTLAREHDRLMQVESILRDFESAFIQVKGMTVKLQYKGGWVLSSGGWRARLDQVQAWTTELWAEHHVAEIANGQAQD